MTRILFLIAVFVLTVSADAQDFSLPLHSGWKFREAATTTWYPAEIPGTVHTDLLRNKLIPDPFYRDNESKVQWVEEKAWDYKTRFSLTSTLLSMPNIILQIDGLDTYAEVFLNGKHILSADNMFRQWNVDIKQLLSPKNLNELVIRFHPAVEVARQKQKLSSVKYPDNERVYLRKAQYQFGWDWGPRMVTAGIWKDIRVRAYMEPRPAPVPARNKQIRLVQQPDEAGESFYFTVDGSPVFIKGANWVPADNFLPRAKKMKRYEQLIKAAKDANINMLRVWGGGVYEDEVFYELCDKYGIMVWQDFMFAGSMYPGDEEFLKNVEEEVRYQVARLRKYECITVWCGNNEIEEGWFNWGWQKQFNYSKDDSLRLWNDYKKIFHGLIPGILKELDPERPYWPSSPSLGWGRKEAYEKGDVHYWGVWWGKLPVEMYAVKVGRFNSEYGMQGFPSIRTIKQFALPADLDTTSAVMKTHQKHPFGYENITTYINYKFRKPKTFDDLVYVSQLMQADALRIAIEAHRRNAPVTMGTLFWQWNDCWPVVSWSSVDYFGRKKAAWYQVKRLFADPVVLPYLDTTGMLKVKVVDMREKGYYSLLIDSVKLDATSFNTCELVSLQKPSDNPIAVDFETFQPAQDIVYRFRLQRNGRTVAENTFFFPTPKSLFLEKAKLRFQLEQGRIVLSSDRFAYGVFIDVPDGVELADNFFHLFPGEKKVVSFTSKMSLSDIRKSIKIRSLVDTY